MPKAPLSLLLASLLLATAARAESVGVMPVAEREAEDAAEISAWIYEVLYERADVEVVGADLMRRHTRDAAKYGIRCDATEPDCAAKIGAVGGVDRILLPQLDGPRFRLRLLQAAGAAITRDLTAELGERKADRRAGVQAVARAVLEGGRLEGALFVKVSQPGASIVVDGRPLGESPLKAPIGALPPGRRGLRVEKPGFRPYRGEAQVLAGVIARVEVELEAIPEGAEPEPDPDKPPPPPPPNEGPGALFWTGASVAAVGVVAAAGLGVGSALVYVPESGRSGLSAEEFNFRSRTLAPALAWSAVGGGALAAVGVALLTVSLLE